MIANVFILVLGIKVWLEKMRQKIEIYSFFELLRASWVQIVPFKSGRLRGSHFVLILSDSQEQRHSCSFTLSFDSEPRS